MSENKSAKYFKYAVGEIVLVVIGILIALAINNWNQERIEKNKEISYLKNLREDVFSNKNRMIRDSIRFKGYLDRTRQGIAIMKTGLNTKNFMEAFKLIDTRWNVQKVNRSTYDEMLNNGSFYNIKNKNLREQIANYYIHGSGNENAFLEINNNGQNIKYNPDIYPIELLVSQLEENPNDLKGIDTSWMSDKNSKIYIGYFRMAKYFESSNSIRIFLMKQFERSCDSLLISLNQELQK